MFINWIINTYLSLSVNSVIKSDNIFMIHLLQQLYLFDDTSLSLIISQLILIIYFHSDIEWWPPMLCLFDYSIGTLAKDLPETVISYWGIVKGSILKGGCLLLLRSLDEGAWSVNLSNRLLSWIYLSLFDWRRGSGDYAWSLCVLVIVIGVWSS